MGCVIPFTPQNNSPGQELYYQILDEKTRNINNAQGHTTR